MANQHVISRLAGIRAQLMAAHQASIALSNVSKGAEREAFVNDFLANVLPPIYRFGTGDATDIAGNRSGQLDVVVEYPFSPTLPSVGQNRTRLYLAESVAAVIEVKSTLPGQWSEVQRTLAALRPLRRSFGARMTMGMAPPDTLPLFVASYTGWKLTETVVEHVKNNPGIGGILIIDAGIFAAADMFGGWVAVGPAALWGLICCLHMVTNSLQAASTDPLDYLSD
jgi:hypothetical protein